jgi:hypothetical protein
VKWQTYSYSYGSGQRAVISFDVDAATEPRHLAHRWCRRVILFLELCELRDDGLPRDEEVREHLLTMETDLTIRLRRDRIDCRYVGRMFYGGMQELVFQVEEVAGFERVVAWWVDTLAHRRVELLESDGWDFFDEKIRPGPAHWQEIRDRRVIGELVAAGSDPSRPHPLEHTFEGPSARLDEIARQLGADGFRRHRSSREVLVVSRAATLDHDEIARLTRALHAYAAAMGVAYRGWGSPVVRG